MSLCSRRPHRTFVPLSPSCTGRSYKSRRARCALMVLDALLWRRTAAAPLCSRRPHRTFKPLSPSCRAIVHEVETRSLCAHGTRCPSLALDRRRPCALAVHIGRLYRSLAIVQGDCTSRDALVGRSWYSMPFFGVGPPPPLCSRRPHRTFVLLSPSC